MRISSNVNVRPDQQKVINSPLDSSHVVTGPAGTGKTYTAVMRLEALLENDDSNQVIFFTASNHMTLMNVKRHLKQVRMGASLVDIAFSGNLNDVLKQAIESKRKNVVFFLTNVVLSNFIATALPGGKQTPINALKEKVADDASFATLIGNYKLHLLVDEAQVVSKVFLEELFDAFVPGTTSSDSRLFLDFKVNLFLDPDQIVDTDSNDRSVMSHLMKGQHFVPRITLDSIRSVFEKYQPNYEEIKLTETIVQGTDQVSVLLNRYLDLDASSYGDVLGLYLKRYEELNQLKETVDFSTNPPDKFLTALSAADKRFLSEVLLDENEKDAVDEGENLVLGPAGTGKTYTAIKRVDTRKYGIESEELEILRKIIRSEAPTDEDYEQFQSQLAGFARAEVERLRDQFDSVRHMLKSRAALFGSDPRMEEIFESSLNDMFVGILEVLDPDNQKVREFQVENGIAQAAIVVTRPPSVEDLQKVVRLSLDHLIFGLVANGYEPDPEIVINLVKSMFPRLDEMVRMDINVLLMESMDEKKDRKPKRIYQKFESVVSSIFYHVDCIGDLHEDVVLSSSWEGEDTSTKTRNPLHALDRAFHTCKWEGRELDRKVTDYFQDEPDWQDKWNDKRNALSRELDSIDSKRWNLQTTGVVQSVLEEQLTITDKDFFESQQLQTIAGKKAPRQLIRVGLANTVMFPLEDDDVFGAAGEYENYNWLGLCLSVFFGHSEAASEFLNRGAFEVGSEIQGLGDDQPVLLGRLLRLAFERDHVEVAKVLLEHSPSPELDTGKLELTTTDGLLSIAGSLLGTVIAREHMEMIDLAVEKAGLTIGNMEIEIASWCKNPAVLEGLAKHGVELESVTVNDRRTLLHEARSPAVAAFLLDRGLDPNARTAEGETPLHTCCVGSSDRNQVSDKESLGIAKLLISNGADVLAKDVAGRQVHHIAAEANNTELFKYLLKNTDLELEATDDEGKTCMHYIAMQGRYSDHKQQLEDIKDWKIAELLMLDMKADINAQDVNGWSPLHHAAELREKEVLGHFSDGLEESAFLIGCGADLLLTTKDGKKASDIARQARSKKLERLLLHLEENFADAERYQQLRYLLLAHHGEGDLEELIDRLVKPSLEEDALPW
jgi:ankyrin repeat protein